MPIQLKHPIQERRYGKDVNITPAMLNDAYGDMGRTFERREDAERSAKVNPGSYIVRIVDTLPMSDMRRETGWLVTYPKSYRLLLVGRKHAVGSDGR